METNFKKIKIVFSSEDELKKLSKEEIIYRNKFLSKLQQKFDFSLLDLNDLSVSSLEENIIQVSSFNKNDLKFIFLKNEGDKNLIIKYDEKIEKFIRKNKGLSFIVLSNNDKSDDYTIINSKDYFDLFLHDNGNGENILISEFKNMPILKKLKNLLFK